MAEKLQWSTTRSGREKRRAEQVGRQELLSTLRRLEEEIRRNEALFNLLVEDDLLEACIYEGKALRSRYRYYHNLARKMGVACREPELVCGIKR